MFCVIVNIWECCKRILLDVSIALSDLPPERFNFDYRLLYLN